MMPCMTELGQRVETIKETPNQWFSIFLMPQPFNIVPGVVVTPKHKIIPLLLLSCNFATVMNHHIKYAGRLIHNPEKRAG